MVEENFVKPELIKDDSALWYHFCRAALLGGNLTGAEVNYEFNLLLKNGLFDRQNLKRDWAVNAKTYFLAKGFERAK